MSHPYKAKGCGLIDTFNDIFQYLDDLFTINNLDFDKKKSRFLYSWTSVE